MTHVRAVSLLACTALLAACSLPMTVGNPPTQTSIATSTAPPTETSRPTWTPEPAAEAMPVESLVAYYPFAGDAADASGNGNDGQLFGPATGQDRFGVPDQALQFDGQGDHILVPESASFGLNGDFSVALWLNPSGPDFFGPILFRFARRPPKIEGWELQFDSKYLGHAAIYDPISDASSAGELMRTKGAIPDSVWTCLVFTLDASENAWAFYLNGRQNAQGSNGEQTKVLNPSAQLYIGGMPRFSTFFSGSLDEIAIYDRALSGEEARAYCASRSGIQPAASPTATRTRTPTATRTVERTPGCDAGFSQLAIGEYAILTEGALPNRVRSEPRLDDNVVSLLYEGTTVKVLGGPVCADGLIFWKVESTTIPDGSGWTAEGDGTDYYLAPYRP